nr:transporter substrate-binding domain-containing protein [uncultured Kingella sp.]
MRKTHLIPLIAALALFGCGQSEVKKVAEPKVASDAAVNDNRPVYNVYFDINGIAPFVMADADNRPSGFGIDLVTAIGDKQGFRPNFIPHDFTGMLEDLGKGADMAVSAISITDERRALVDFTNSHFESSQALLVPEGSTITTVNDLKGKKVAIAEGSVGEDMLSQIQAGNGSIVRNPSVWAAVQQVMRKEVDAAFSDVAPLTYYANNYKDRKLRVIIDPSLPKDYYALAVAKGKPELLKKLNAGIEQVKADGTFDKIYQKWFKSSMPEQAAEASAAATAAK